MSENSAGINRQTRNTGGPRLAPRAWERGRAGGQSGSGCGDVGRSLAADRSCGQLFRECYLMLWWAILRRLIFTP